MTSGRIAPVAYRLAKRHKAVRRLALLVARLVTTTNSRLRTRGLFTKESSPPYGQCESTLAWVSSYVGRESDSPRYESIHPAHTMLRSPPQTIEAEVHRDFRREYHHESPETFVAVVPGGRTCGEGFVVTADNLLLGDVSKVAGEHDYTSNPREHPIFLQRRLPPPLQVDGQAAVLSIFGGRGYYHWMFEVLPRFEILRRSSVDLALVDKFVINSYVAGFHKEGCARLGIRREQVIESFWHPHVHAHTLVVPSFAGAQAEMPGWTCDFLRQTFLPDASKSGSRRYPKRIYITRRSAGHRRVANEQALVAWLASLGFEEIAAESLSISEQACLFEGAEIVVAPHGAGLTNVVFCRPGTKIIELFSPRAVNPLFWKIANHVGLDYYYVLGEEEQPAYRNAARPPIEEDIHMSLDKLAETFRLARLL